MSSSRSNVMRAAIVVSVAVSVALAAGASAGQGAPGSAGTGLGALAGPLAPTTTTPPAPASAPPITSPPLLASAYRHGVFPSRPASTTDGYASTDAAAAAGPLQFHPGFGVMTGALKVYIVFWGSQWGTESVNGQGYLSLSGDPNGAADVLQAFFKGLGTDGETWSDIMTQYCQGAGSGASACPSTAMHVGYPTGGALAGAWADEASAAPTQATASQIAAEAVRAAGHFGNTTAVSNVDVQYDIVSPPGTHPDGFNTPGVAFCAWHGYTGELGLAGGPVDSPYGPIAFTNMPYVTDAGAACGENFVNAGAQGIDDGFTIVNGAEYAETITDAFGTGGWTDASGNEDANKCAWVAGSSQDVTLGTGSFAVPSIWANDLGSSGGCEVSHQVTTATPHDIVAVEIPRYELGRVGTAVNLQVHALDTAPGQTLSYSATALPAGLALNPSTGVISGTPTTPGLMKTTVTVTDTTGASGSASFIWVLRATPRTSCVARQLLGNPGFESGSLAPWSATPAVLNTSLTEPPRSGAADAWLDGYGYSHTDTLSQTVTLPSGCATYSLSFWLHIDAENYINSPDTAQNFLQVQLLDSSGAVLTTLATYSNLDAAPGYFRHTFDITAYKGQQVTVALTGTESSIGPTSFVVDDFALYALPARLDAGNGARAAG